MLRKYPDIMEEYLPCVLLSVEQGNVIQDTLLEQVIFRLQAEELRKAIQGLEAIHWRRLVKFFFAPNPFGR